MFDTAEAYAAGNSELEMYVLHIDDVSLARERTDAICRGRVLTELGLRRKQSVSTHDAHPSPSSNVSLVFSIIEGTQGCLERLGVDYVDVIFAHRPDPTGMFRGFYRE
jgi:aryl-alcohol dehydrogenase-like predicted oxidoreductase